jgi:mannitol-specific phosphotransferase system IIBC component
MMVQIDMLLHIKEKKEEQAARRVQQQRQQLAESSKAVDEAREVLDANAQTLSSRQDAVYRRILNRRVGITDIEVANGALMEIDRGHDLLVAAVNRAVYVQERAAADLAGCLDAHRQATRTRDKYLTLADDLRTQLSEQQMQRDETEVEDMFGSRFKRLA